MVGNINPMAGISLEITKASTWIISFRIFILDRYREAKHSLGECRLETNDAVKRKWRSAILILDYSAYVISDILFDDYLLSSNSILRHLHRSHLTSTLMGPLRSILSIVRSLSSLGPFTAVMCEIRDTE